MAEFPALQLWTDAYLGDTTHLTTIEHGAYFLLLVTAWRTRDIRLPDDDRLLARYARCSPAQWKRLRPILAPFFRIENGFWTQGRLTDEAAAVRQKREKAALAGRASALKKQGRHSTDVDAELPPSGNETPTQGQPYHSHSHNHEERKEETAPEGAAPFFFQGRIIRLNEIDFRRWEKAYPLLDLGAVLQSRDDWLATDADEATRKKWFISTSNHLANLQSQAAVDEKRAADQGLPIC